MNSVFQAAKFRFSGRCPNTVRTSNLEQEALLRRRFLPAPAASCFPVERKALARSRNLYYLGVEVEAGAAAKLGLVVAARNLEVTVLGKGLDIAALRVEPRHSPQRLACSVTLSQNEMTPIPLQAMRFHCQ